MADYIHIGGKIEELLEEQHKTKKDLGIDIGMSASNAAYLTTRESIDVRTLHKIGNALKYNFFKHFPIEEEKKAESTGGWWHLKDEKDRMIDELKGKITGQEKVVDDMKREMELLKQENGYLKEINGLLKASPRPPVRPEESGR